MNETRIFRHQDYELACTAEVTDDGRFKPALIVSRQVWPSRPRTIALERGAHDSADHAIEAAHAQGLEWIRNFG